MSRRLFPRHIFSSFPLYIPYLFLCIFVIILSLKYFRTSPQLFSYCCQDSQQNFDWPCEGNKLASLPASLSPGGGTSQHGCSLTRTVESLFLLLNPNPFQITTGLGLHSSWATTAMPCSLHLQHGKPRNSRPQGGPQGTGEQPSRKRTVSPTCAGNSKLPPRTGIRRLLSWKMWKQGSRVRKVGVLESEFSYHAEQPDSSTKWGQSPTSFSTPCARSHGSVHLRGASSKSGQVVGTVGKRRPRVTTLEQSAASSKQ